MNLRIVSSESDSTILLGICSRFPPEAQLEIWAAGQIQKISDLELFPVSASRFRVRVRISQLLCCDHAESAARRKVINFPIPLANALAFLPLHIIGLSVT
jgi:hypothetical protein